MKKAVFVTGATVGSGLASAERFAKEGYDVFIQSRDAARAQEAAEGVAKKYGVFAKGYGIVPGNEKDVEDVFADIDSLGRIVKTVVLNAANMGFGNDPVKGMPFFEVSVEEFADVFNTNLVWNFTIVRAAARRMKDNGGGDFVKVSESLDWAGLKAKAGIVGTSLVNEDGEIIPGIEVVEREPKFMVET